ncbi:MAG: hypothetical protein DDT32_01287 [Syntrophomonadaceae bacterium]|nr:hypothetical protein [Bacillota bacterium]
MKIKTYSGEVNVEAEGVLSKFGLHHSLGDVVEMARDFLRQELKDTKWFADDVSTNHNSYIFFQDVLTKEYVYGEKYLLHPELKAAMEQLEKQKFTL